MVSLDPPMEVSLLLRLDSAGVPYERSVSICNSAS